MVKKFLNFIGAMTKGHTTVLKHTARKRITLEYPEIKRPVSDKFRGKIEFLYDENGKTKCTGCGLCQKVCPCKDLIKIERSKDESGKLKVDKYEMNMSQCIFCGNCVSYCPAGALKMTKNYELASLNKKDLVLSLKGVI